MNLLFKLGTWRRVICFKLMKEWKKGSPSRQEKKTKEHRIRKTESRNRGGHLFLQRINTEFIAWHFLSEQKMNKSKKNETVANCKLVTVTPVENMRSSSKWKIAQNISIQGRPECPFFTYSPEQLQFILQVLAQPSPLLGSHCWSCQAALCLLHMLPSTLPVAPW